MAIVAHPTELSRFQQNKFVKLFLAPCPYWQGFLFHLTMIKNISKFFFLSLIVVAIFFGWIFFGSATNFSQEQKYLYVATGKLTKEEVIKSIIDSSLLKRTNYFQWLGTQWNLWPRLRPGKFEIKKGASLFSIVRKLRNNQQEEVNLVIKKIRTKKDFASLVGKKFETDSLKFLQFLSQNDSIKKYALDTNTIMTMVLPNTYSYYWSTTPTQILNKLFTQHKKFWTNERKQKATLLGLTKEQVYILASIVEEETLQNDEKSTISSVYLNRLKINMPLGADPTVKFAVGDFSIKRLLFGHINATASSPYNTYKNKGLPPGPICTPMPVTIDAVLNTKPTNYLFFCAKVNGKGYHAFATNETDHFKNAKAYQQWLNERQIH